LSTAPGERIAHLVPPGMAAAPKKRSKARSKPLAVIEPAATEIVPLAAGNGGRTTRNYPESSPLRPKSRLWRRPPSALPLPCAIGC